MIQPRISRTEKSFVGGNKMPTSFSKKIVKIDRKCISRIPLNQTVEIRSHQIHYLRTRGTLYLRTNSWRRKRECMTSSWDVTRNNSGEWGRISWLLSSNEIERQHNSYFNLHSLSDFRGRLRRNWKVNHYINVLVLYGCTWRFTSSFNLFRNTEIGFLSKHIFQKTFWKIFLRFSSW